MERFTPLKSYTTKERQRVEQHLAALRQSDDFNVDSYQRKQQTPPPHKVSTIKQLGRLALDTLPVPTRLRTASHQKRDQEARAIAQEEFESENSAKQQAILEQTAAKAVKEEQNRAAQAAEKAAREQAQADADFLSAMQTYRRDKLDDQKSERVQELSERAFNSQLTSLEDIDAISEIEGQDITKRQLDYEGTPLTVYDIKGHPLNLLEHFVNFKGSGETTESHRTGASTAKQLQDDPSLWTAPREASLTYGYNTPDAKADTISTTYVDTDHNLRALVLRDNPATKPLIYGFSRVLPDSILQITNGDGATPGSLGQHKTFLREHHPYMPDTLVQPGMIDNYNEVQLRRYDPSGRPQLPDFLIATDGRTSDTILRHAAFFGVPILNLETKYYAQKEAAKLEALIDTIDEDTPYQETKKVLNTLNSSFLTTRHVESSTLGLWTNGQYSPIKNIYRTRYDQAFEAKVQTFVNTELTQRIAFLKDTLQDAVAGLNSATARGNAYIDQNPTIRHISKDDHGDGFNLDALHRISLDIAGSPKTEAYDGAHPSPNAHPHTGANSKYYDELLPFVSAYTEALKQNQKIAHSPAEPTLAT